MKDIIHVQIRGGLGGVLLRLNRGGFGDLT